jgi:hypothetical protein
VRAQHRKKIFTLAGDRERRPIAVRPAERTPAGKVVMPGVLGRLGRVSSTPYILYREDHTTHKDIENAVPGVPSTANTLQHAPPHEHLAAPAGPPPAETPVSAPLPATTPEAECQSNPDIPSQRAQRAAARWLRAEAEAARIPATEGRENENEESTGGKT